MYMSMDEASKVLELAKNGDPDAQCRYALYLYQRDYDIPREQEEFAEKLLLNAAMQGHEKAHYELGHFYQWSLYFKDFEKSLEWYHKGAELGDAEAQYCLGGIYRSGDKVQRDINQAIKWYTCAAEQGHSPSMFRLGKMYHDEGGVEKNEKLAIKWLKKAALDWNGGAHQLLEEFYPEYYTEGKKRERTVFDVDDLSDEVETTLFGKTTLNNILQNIMQHFDKVSYQDKEKGMYEGKSSKELYGVSEEELTELYDILPRGSDGELAEISKEGTIEFISDGGFKYRFSSSMGQDKKTSPISKQIWITRSVILDESDDTQYIIEQDTQYWPRKVDKATNTSFRAMFEYEVKLDERKTAEANKIIPRILDNPEEAKLVGSMLDHHIPRDEHHDERFNFYLLGLGLFSLMGRDKNRSEKTARYPQGSNTYVKKWRGKFNINHDGIKWSFIAIHEMDGDPYFGDNAELLQVKCPKKGINMIIYRNVHRGSL